MFIRVNLRPGSEAPPYVVSDHSKLLTLRLLQAPYTSGEVFLGDVKEVGFKYIVIVLDSCFFNLVLNVSEMTVVDQLEVFVSRKT